MKIGAAIRDIWSDFMNEFNHLKWKADLAEVVEYIIANKKLPSQYDKDPNIKVLGKWLSTQQQNYKNEKKIMKNVIIRDIWIIFKIKNEKYFPSNYKKSKLKPQHNKSDTSEILSSQ
jgi:hypothetical protein